MKSEKITYASSISEGKGKILFCNASASFDFSFTFFKKIFSTLIFLSLIIVGCIPKYNECESLKNRKEIACT